MQSVNGRKRSIETFDILSSDEENLRTKKSIVPLSDDQINLYSKSQMDTTGQPTLKKKARKKFVPMRPIIETSSTDSADSGCSQPKSAESQIILSAEETVPLKEFKQLQNENKELREIVQSFSKDKDQIQEMLNQWSQKLNKLSESKKLKEDPKETVNGPSKLVAESSVNDDIPRNSDQTSSDLSKPANSIRIHDTDLLKYLQNRPSTALISNYKIPKRKIVKEDNIPSLSTSVVNEETRSSNLNLNDKTADHNKAILHIRITEANPAKKAKTNGQSSELPLIPLQPKVPIEYRNEVSDAASLHIQRTNQPTLGSSVPPKQNLIFINRNENTIPSYNQTSYQETARIVERPLTPISAKPTFPITNIDDFKVFLDNLTYEKFFEVAEIEIRDKVKQDLLEQKQFPPRLLLSSIIDMKLLKYIVWEKSSISQSQIVLRNFPEFIRLYVQIFCSLFTSLNATNDRMKARTYLKELCMKKTLPSLDSLFEDQAKEVTSDDRTTDEAITSCDEDVEDITPAVLTIDLIDSD